MKRMIGALAISLLAVPLHSAFASEVKSNTSIQSISNAVSSSNKTIDSEDNTINITNEAKAEASASVSAGRKGTISAYAISSVQGENGATYIPSFERFANDGTLYEYKNAGITESRFFNRSNLKPSFFSNQGNFDIDYIEALNWLYKNNYLHGFSNLSVANSINGADRFDNGGIENNVFEQSGGSAENVKFLVLDKGTYSVNVNAATETLKDKDGNQISYPDTLSAYSNGQQLFNAVTVNGSTSQILNITENGTKVDLIINKGGNKNKDSSWYYYISGVKNFSNKYLGENNVKYSETNQDFISSKDGSFNRTIKRKDFVMELMKIADGVVESRPMLIQNRYLLFDEIGHSRYETDTLPILSTPFKKQMGSLGVDSFLNDVSVDFKNYGMHYLFVNPNVYELYFRKALNSGIIDKTDFRSTFTDLNGEETPRWDYKLPDIRVNQTGFQISNNGKNSVKSDTKIFGNSYTYSDSLGNADDSNAFDFSSTYQSFSINYDPTYEYFEKPGVSYIEAANMLYRASIAYSDERLNQKEVDSIVSMYGVKYSNLSNDQKTAINYLIAKGIIDGNEAEKFTSNSAIPVEDAVIMLYRYANKSARLSFKTNFSVKDQEMLSKGLAQSTTKVLPYATDPTIETKVSSATDYYIVFNNALRLAKIDDNTEVSYQLGTERGKATQSSNISYQSFLINAENNLIDGVEPFEQNGYKFYEIHKYSIPDTEDITSLGLTISSSYSIDQTDWLPMPLAGGIYYVTDKSIDSSSKGKDVQMSRVAVSAAPSTPVFSELYKKMITEEQAKKDKQAFKVKSLKGKVAFTVSRMLSYILGEQPAYAEEVNEYYTISVIINDIAKKHILYQNKPMFVCTSAAGDRSSCDLTLSDEVVTKLDAQGTPSVRLNPNPLGEGKSELIFNLLKFDGISATTVRQSLLKQLKLDGEGTVNDVDIATYTGLQTGETMISIEELKSFGIEANKEEPDVLHKFDINTHEDTGMYAYLNQEQSYALIGNTLHKYPKDTVMIGDPKKEGDIYYNVKIVMSMLSEKNFFVFNDQGDLEIVKKLDGVSYADVFNPNTGDKAAHAIVAGDKINISSVSGEANTFFMVFDDVTNYKRIYGFQPYYEVSNSSSIPNFVTVQDMIDDMSPKTPSLTEIDNILINNAITRMEFETYKEGKFVFTDNAIRVTQFTTTDDPDNLAGAYLSYFKAVAQNISENDIKSYGPTSNYSLSQLITQQLKDGLFLYPNSEYATALLKKDQSGNVVIGKSDEVFWVLYLMAKFNVTGLGDNEAAFYEALYQKFNESYGSTLSLKSSDALGALKTKTAGVSDLSDRRTFTFKKMVDDAGVLKTDNGGGHSSLEVQKNGAVYIDILSKDSGTAPYMEDILGTYYYYDGNIVNSIGDVVGSNIMFKPTLQYKALTKGRAPLESLKNGSKFKMNGESYTVMNNSVLYQNGKDPIVLVKVVADNLYLSSKTRAEFLQEEKDRLGDLSKGIFSLPDHTQDGIQEYSDLLSHQEVKYLIDSDNVRTLPFQYNTVESGKEYYIKTFNGALERWSRMVPASSGDTKLFFDQDLLINPDVAEKVNLSTTDVALAYKSFLINPGTISVDVSDSGYGEAHLEPRTYNYMSTRSPLNDLVNELIKAVKSARTEIQYKRVGDIPNGEVLKIEDLSLVRTKDSTYSPDSGGFISFITKSIIDNGDTNISQQELLFDKSLLIRNYSMLESIKVPVGRESGKPLYQLVGNLNLNLPQEQTVTSYLKSLDMVNKSFIIENRPNGGGSEIKAYKPEYSLNLSLIGVPPELKGGSASPIKGTTDPYPYFLSMLLDPNLEVFKTDDGTWKIQGYANTDVVDIKAFQSRISKFNGIYANNIIMLPTAANVDGGLLGFLLSKFQMDRLKDSLSLKYWNKTFRQWVLEAESVLPTIGIWYLYLLLLFTFLGKESLMSIFYRRVFDPVKLMTFNKVSIDTVDATRLTIRVTGAIIVLSLLYEGYYRKAIVSALSGLAVASKYFYNPFQ